MTDKSLIDAHRKEWIGRYCPPLYSSWRSITQKTDNFCQFTSNFMRSFQMSVWKKLEKLWRFWFYSEPRGVCKSSQTGGTCTRTITSMPTMQVRIGYSLHSEHNSHEQSENHWKWLKLSKCCWTFGWDLLHFTLTCDVLIIPRSELKRRFNVDFGDFNPKTQKTELNRWNRCYLQISKRRRIISTLYNRR